LDCHTFIQKPYFYNYGTLKTNKTSKMAPDGEKVRQRRVTTRQMQSAPHAATTPTVATTTTSQLKTTEMCIDGIIYDIEAFSSKHPGGITFLTFGGNDVTTQYKMIHPYHTDKHLLKMGPPVGIVQDYHSELRIEMNFVDFRWVPNVWRVGGRV
jgi:acyl-lipid (7-3)-desaturase (Delta-4 desaturase)